ncbi:uncharacterized protein EDB91DRAFT_1239099 [Suillus paluster]|uniref:uncharacterized protein n=1 Tax=Suillus paluster TaxID=48578 RepID=UPI001B862A33|nr:uncharacterized protein EDB91DRAFT_1239099 [Suillus paluster]KAG1730410.1 hypothetical protein EDB91DRAFT_1239099 [Suillus paluster]
MLDRLQDDPYAYRWKINHYYPFHDKGEWELGKFLVENLTQTQMIKFLKLKWFNTHARLSFTMKDQLLDWMDSLSCFTEWKVSKIEFSGYKTVHPIELIWCNALEVVKQLFSNPIFANHMTYTPHIVNVGNQCEYGDYMSTDMAWKIQDYLPMGATQVPIILGSDKTHCIAYMPITNILQARLWHKCMDLVLTNLKAMAVDGCSMPDPSLTHLSSDPWDPDKFQKAAKAVNLSGVHMPYWHDWPFACPSVFLAGEETVGAYELDSCFIVQHKWVGTCHFTKGITHIKQMMDREYRDIQRTIVASIAGTASPQFVCAICAIMEFIYLAQNLVHSAQSLQSMEQALLDFHSFKGTIIEAEARKGKKGVKEDFFIPKLELLQSFKADTTERLLITHCKDLFPRTARQSKDFMEQCMEIFDLYALLTSHGVPLVNAMHAEEEEVTVTNPALLWVSQVLPDEVTSICGPRPVHNHFLKGILSEDALTTFQLNNKFQLQLHSAFQQWLIMPSRVVQAYPPSDIFPFGNCDTALIDTMGINGKMTSYVAQVRLIFQPIVQQGSNLGLPSYLSNPLLYVQFFCFVANPDDCPELVMWTVELSYPIPLDPEFWISPTKDENGNCHREGAVVQVTYATHMVELIPVYGEAVGNGVSSMTCLESYKHFFLNNFTDKESYHTFKVFVLHFDS